MILYIDAANPWEPQGHVCMLCSESEESRDSCGDENSLHALPAMECTFGLLAS